MRKLIYLALVAVVVTAFGLTGCAKKQTGTREFIPGRGWVPTN